MILAWISAKLKLCAADAALIADSREGYEKALRALEKAVTVLDWYAGDCEVDEAGSKMGVGWDAKDALAAIEEILNEGA